MNNNDEKTFRSLQQTLKEYEERCRKKGYEPSYLSRQFKKAIDHREWANSIYLAEHKGKTERKKDKRIGEFE